MLYMPRKLTLMNVNDGLTSGKVPLEKTMRRQVFPQAPSPTMTSFLLISAMLIVVDLLGCR